MIGIERFILRDDQWEWVKHLLPGKETDRGVPAKDNRWHLEAVLGNPVRWRLTPGQRHDITQAQALVEGWTTQAVTQAVVADKAFDADEFIESIKKTGAQAVIPPRDNRTQARDYDRHLYKDR